MSRTGVLAVLLLLACGPTQKERIVMSVTVPGPSPYDHAFEGFMVFGVLYPDLWRIAGSTTFAALEDGEPVTYNGFVVEVVLENEKIPPQCESGNHTSVYGWRALPGETGIETLMARVPPSKPRQTTFPLGPGEICLFRPQPKATAWMGYIIDYMDLSREVAYRSRSGTVSAYRWGLEHGTKCPDSPSGAWKWGNGTSCLAFTYQTAMHGDLARLSDTTLTNFRSERTLHFQTRLPGIRVTIDCATNNPFPMYCRE